MAGVEQIRHFIGGESIPSADGRDFDNVAPATGQVVSRVARGGPTEIAWAATAARAAMAGPWGRTTATERAVLLDQAADLLERRSEELARIESRDTGKTYALASTVDLPRAVANLRFFAGAVRHDETGFHHTGNALNYTLRQPVGVAGLISPWNLPLYLLSWKAAPALAMGNAVVAKPSELTPGTASLLAEILHDAGFPAGAFNVVHGFGPEAGQALVEHPDVKAISFTGGTATGRLVAATAAPRFKKLSLELGGKNPTIVFADAGFDAAVDGALRAAFLNQGQICLCGSRILVERPLYERFVEQLVLRTKALVIGDPAARDTFLGSLISLAHREKVERYLALAREEGGEIRCGGARPDLPEPFDQGAFLTPAVITGLPATCRTATEEIFGPVVTVHPFDDEAEALSMANGVAYGLSASVWTKNLDRAHRVSAALQCGLVWVNTWLRRDLRTPFGGVKASGVGREGGRWSLDFFSETLNVCIELSEDPR
jgi:aminomuconate-semialdehyde/2-hydroxymuconate-6-semialdehyde dehydrogenase